MKQIILLFLFLSITISPCWAEQDLVVTPRLGQKSETIKIQHFDDADGFSETVVTHIIQDNKGYIWLATWDGLRRYDGYRFQTFKARPGDYCPLETNRINYIVEENDRSIICWSNNKFYRFDTQTHRFSPFEGNVPPQIFHPSAKAEEILKACEEYKNIEYAILFEDNQNGIWVNSYRGLERISEIPTIHKTDKAGKLEEVICATYLDRSKRLWVADKYGFIRIFDEKRHECYLSVDGRISTDRRPFGYAAYSIFEDSKRQIWIGCKPGGLFRLTPISAGYKVTRYLPNNQEPYAINSEAVYDIQETGNGRILIATYGGGLNIAEQQIDGQMKFINCNNLLKNYPKQGLRSRCLCLTNDGTVLLGTNDGLYTTVLKGPYERMRFYVNNRRPNDASSISNNYVMRILATDGDNYYACTSGGGTDRVLSRQLLSDTIRFQHYSTDEGISSDLNLTLTMDSNGNIWIVSAGSLSMLNPRTGIAANYWRLLTEKGEMFTEAKPTILPDGVLIFGTTMGFLPIDPKEIAKSNYQPRIVFDCEKNVDLSPDKKDFSLRFAALDYNKNEAIVYAYQMEGIDKEWHYTRTNELNYVGLAPGTYQLHIKSTNGDGVWVDNEEVITIHRAAHFNETPWAWMLYGLLLALFLIGVAGTIRYVLILKRELKDVKLTSKQQIELLGTRIKELLPITESVKVIREENEELNNEDRQFAYKLKTFVEQNMSNSELSVLDIAQAMNISRTKLFARTKQIFDSSPNNYVLNSRINYAKRLLLEPESRVSEVAFKCGFSDPKYFSKCFKTATGKTPSEYKNYS